MSVSDEMKKPAPFCRRAGSCVAQSPLFRRQPGYRKNCGRARLAIQGMQEPVRDNGELQSRQASDGNFYGLTGGYGGIYQITASGQVTVLLEGVFVLIQKGRDDPAAAHHPNIFA